MLRVVWSVSPPRPRSVPTLCWTGTAPVPATTLLPPLRPAKTGALPKLHTQTHTQGEREVSVNKQLPTSFFKLPVRKLVITRSETRDQSQTSTSLPERYWDTFLANELTACKQNIRWQPNDASIDSSDVLSWKQCTYSVLATPICPPTCQSYLSSCPSTVATSL